MSKVRQTLISLVFLIFGGLASASIGRFLPFSGFYPIPKKTPEPININTLLTYPIFPPEPLTFLGNNGQEDAYIENNGQSLIATLKQNYTTNIVKGGPLGKSIYTYVRTVFRWTNDTNGYAYTTVNGKNGSPLEVLIVYYNQKYSSYEEAFKYRDGIAKFCIRIYIGSKPNPAFEEFAKVVEKILNPGPPVPISLQAVFKWYYNFPSKTKYFVYPGSVTNITTGETFYCSTTMIAEFNSHQFISEKQFESIFLKLLSLGGQPYSTPKPQNSRGFRPIARGRGILKKPTFNKVVYRSVIGST